jgi:hypothetical protein
MKSLYNTDTKEFTFNFIMCIEGKAYRVEAIACEDDIMLSEQYRPEYIDVYMAKLTHEKTGELTESNVYKNENLLKVVSDMLTKRLITNASKTWFVTDAPRLFLEQFDTSLEIMFNK